MSPAARALLFAVRVYQAFFSALMPSACKFYPSCSHYAADALRIHGARRGTWLALRRLARCHPFSRGGVDLVPSRTGFEPVGVPIPTKVKLDRLKACPTEEVHS
jgi:putative membrane protein insertion efficiency factor